MMKRKHALEWKLEQGNKYHYPLFDGYDLVVRDYWREDHWRACVNRCTAVPGPFANPDDAADALEVWLRGQYNTLKAIFESEDHNNG